MICQLAGRHPKRISEYTHFGLICCVVAMMRSNYNG
nr:MAG TPA: hypothetical protein [Caudoviricetes sp.]